MKRDMNLIRLLLLETEGEEPKPDLGGYTEAQLVYHSALLIEAKLVHGSVLKESGGEIASTITSGLTWAGHEFLDAARNDTIWKQATDKLKQAGVQVTVSVMQELLKKLLKDSLGLP